MGLKEAHAIAVANVAMAKAKGEPIPKRPRSLPVVYHPYAYEAELFISLRKMVRELFREISVQVTAASFDQLAPHHDSDTRLDDLAGSLKRLFDPLIRKWGQKAEAAKPMVAKLADKVESRNAIQLQGQLKQVIGVNIVQHEPWLADELSAANHEACKLIKDIGVKALADVERIVSVGSRSGQSIKQIRVAIQEQLQVTERRAALIAVDQVGKFNGSLNRLRQKDLGVESYNWATCGDSRVRQAHKARQGVEFLWSEPPADGHPGWPVRCRCVAQPVLKAFADILSMTPEQLKARAAARNGKMLSEAAQIQADNKLPFKRFDSADDFANWSKDKYGKKHLSEVQVASIRLLDKSDAINEALREGNEMGAYEGDVKRIDASVKYGKVTGGGIIMYAGVDSSVTAQLETGIWEDKGYTIAAPTPGLARTSKAVVELHIPNGTSAYSLTEATGKSHAGLVLGRGLSWDVDSVETRNGVKHYIVSLREEGVAVKPMPTTVVHPPIVIPTPIVPTPPPTNGLSNKTIVELLDKLNSKKVPGLEMKWADYLQLSKNKQIELIDAVSGKDYDKWKMQFNEHKFLMGEIESRGIELKVPIIKAKPTAVTPPVHKPVTVTPLTHKTVSLPTPSGPYTTTEGSHVRPIRPYIKAFEAIEQQVVNGEPTLDQTRQFGKIISDEIAKRFANPAAELMGDYEELKYSLDPQIAKAEAELKLHSVDDVQWQAAYDKISNMRKQLRDADVTQKIQDLRRGLVLEVLGEIRPMGGTFEKLVGPKALQKRAQDAAEAFPTRWIKMANSYSETTLKKSKRGYCSLFEIALSGSDDRDGRSVVTHEFMHRMENTHKGASGRSSLQRLQREEYARRTAGEVAKPKVGDRESMVRKDKFFNDYMGRDYSDKLNGVSNSYEIMTMGYEAQVEFRYMRAALPDTETREFVLGVLSGVR